MIHALLLGAIVCCPPSLAGDEAPGPGPSAEASIGATFTTQLDGVESEVALERAPDGSIRFLLETRDGDAVTLTPEEFARRVYDQQAGRPWWKRIFNITSAAGLLWVGLGFLGQALFSGRMLVQWLVSERRKRSVVPVAFWWLSLTGASMLLVYFVWRKDIVGILGQATGWTIYARNLHLLYRREAGSLESG